MSKTVTDAVPEGLPPVITAAWLRERGACPAQVARFEQLWPGGCPATRENAHRARRDGLSLTWLVREVRGVLAMADANGEFRRVLREWEHRGDVLDVLWWWLPPVRRRLKGRLEESFDRRLSDVFADALGLPPGD